MENFDDLVTDRAVRLAGAEAFLKSGAGERLYLNRYVVLSTSGSTGLRGVFLFDPDEWLTAIAGITRPMLWAGVAPHPFRPRRAALLASTADSHYSSRMGRSLTSRFMPTLRMDAGEPLERMVERLNDWQPDVMGVYPSVLRQLATEQIAGRLRIRPRKIATSAEVLTGEDRRRALEAWNTRVWNTYGATEYAPIAGECQFGRMHLFEDGAVIEVEEDRLLLTVFGRRTQPLIRYEISDVVRPVEGECECGRPYRLIETIEGRIEDVLWFGGVAVHPNQFHALLETAPVAAWQVVQEEDAVRVLLAGLRDPSATATIGRAVREMLERSAIAVPVRVEAVGQLQRGATGKAPLVFSRRRTKVA
jgi:phenylacetate-coenzyme A ligase PaaK-like adenylate-forming protein